MADPIPLAQEEMLTRAGRALSKVNLWGRRGLTTVTLDEIEAMACLLAVLGLPHLPAVEAGDPDQPLSTGD